VLNLLWLREEVLPWERFRFAGSPFVSQTAAKVSMQASVVLLLALVCLQVPSVASGPRPCIWTCLEPKCTKTWEVGVVRLDGTSNRVFELCLNGEGIE